MQTTPATTSYSVEEVCRLLEESLNAIEWALSRTSPPQFHATPKGAAAAFQEGAWSMAMNVAHLAVYDERLAIPVLEGLLAGGDGLGAASTPREDAFQRECEALSEEPREAILARLRAARQRQVALVRRFSDEQFNTLRTPLWGKYYGAPLHASGWVAAKSWQHTYEHTNALLRIALFSRPAPTV